MDQREKINETVDMLIDHIHEGVKSLQEGTTADVKNYIAALKSLSEMTADSRGEQSGEELVREGLKEFFRDLNESDS